MKRIITLLILLTSHFIFSQNLSSQLSGEWIVYKTEMKDGSTLYERTNSRNTYLRFAFGDNNSLFLFNKPTKMSGLKNTYTVDNNIIRLTNKNIHTADGFDIDDNSYIIEKITKDSLVIVENFSAPDDKLKRYYCINQHKINNDAIKENADKNIFIANQYCLPKIKPGKYNFTPIAVNFEFSGYMIFDIVNKQITLEVLKYDEGTPDNKKIQKFIKNIENTYDDWYTSVFSKFKKVKLPFYFRNVYGKPIGDGDFKLNKFEYSFGINTMPYPDQEQIDKSRKSNEFYKKGLLAYKDSDYDNAIEYFTKAYQYDNYNIEALYSRAAIYYYTNKKEEACMDWKTLSDLDQKRGIDSYNQYCL
ncbi:hypothetical protein [Flavobacterium sp.]|uniref:hypothetical protein n=1 Tax=Flavobacterium sp. TaxID=239 RepID=UPI003A9003AD